MSERRDNLRSFLPSALVDELPDDAILLDPEELDIAIVNVSDGRAVYDYGQLINAYMQVFSDDEEDEERAWEAAVEWVHYNTLRALPYMPVTSRPIITGMGDDEEDDD